MTGPTRAERLTMPLGATAIRDLTEAAGGCIRPIQLRRTNNATGEVDHQFLPCRSTLDSACPPCAKRAKSLREQQCRDGWHLEHEPDLTPASPDETQEHWLTLRAHAQVRRDTACVNGGDTAELDELITELDDELAACGVRGNLTSRTNMRTDDAASGRRRARSTRRRQDAPELPKRPMTDRTTGNTFTAPDARFTGRRCSLPSPATATARSDPTAPRPTRRPATSSGPRGMRSTSRRCSTGWSRTCVATSATTSSTSPPSSRRSDWLRMRISRSAAPSRAPTCGR